MRRTLFYFLVLLAAVWLGVLMHQNAGYILISYADFTIETSLWFAIIILILLFVVLHFLLRFSQGVSAIGSFFKQWFINRKQRRAQIQLNLGLYDLIEGNYSQAERALVRLAKYSTMPLVNYFAASFVAKLQRAPNRADNYLKLAAKLSGLRPVAANLAKARLEIGRKEWGAAINTLQKLHQLQPKNSLFLQLMQQVYLELKDWRALEKLLPLLNKRKVISDHQLRELELLVYKELLRIGIKNNTVKTIWSALPKALQREPILVAIYAQYLLAGNLAVEAEDLLKLVLHKKLDKNLLDLYAKLPSLDPIKWLMRAEKWLKTFPDNAELLLCLGRICRQQKLWGKARYYLEQSLKIVETPDAYVELGQIMISQQELNQALEVYDKGLRLKLDDG